MDSCSTNPVQKFTQFKDQGLIREAAQQQTRQRGAFRGPQNADLSNEFDAFQSSNARMQDIYREMSVAHAQSHGSLPQQVQPGPHNQWVQQFSQMSVQPQASPSTQLRDPHALPSMPSMQTPMHNQPVRMYQPQAFAPQFPLEQHRTEQPSPSEPTSQDFDRAFTAAEGRMNALGSQMNILGRHNDGMDKAAREVLESVESSTASDAVAAKMRNSNFMDLMKKISNKQTVVKENAFVENTNGATDIEWSGPKTHSADVEIKRPVFEQMEADRSVKTLLQSDLQDPKLGQQPKENAHQYLNRISTIDVPLSGALGDAEPGAQSELQGPKPEEGGEGEPGEEMLSSFRAAEELGPVPVSIANWEEDYSAWVQ